MLIVSMFPKATVTGLFSYKGNLPILSSKCEYFWGVEIYWNVLCSFGIELICMLENSDRNSEFQKP